MNVPFTLPILDATEQQGTDAYEAQILSLIGDLKRQIELVRRLEKARSSNFYPVQNQVLENIQHLLDQARNIRRKEARVKIKIYLHRTQEAIEEIDLPYTNDFSYGGGTPRKRPTQILQGGLPGLSSRRR